MRWGRRVMTKTLASTSVYAYTTLVSVIICVPLALLFEGGTLVEGSKAAIAKVGAQRFWTDLIGVGLLYHLYIQVSGSLGWSPCRQSATRGNPICLKRRLSSF